MKKKEKSLAELNSSKLIELKDKVKKLPLKEAEKMVRGLDKDRDRYIYLQTRTMLKESESTEKNLRQLSESFRKRLADEELTADTIDRVFNELITDAYLDRGLTYCMTIEGGILDKIDKFQAIRQKADNHLVRMIRAFVDIKRPLIKVFVRKVDQLNVSDKQVNISQKSTNDLDKNNEKIS